MTQKEKEREKRTVLKHELDRFLQLGQPLDNHGHLRALGGVLVPALGNQRRDFGGHGLWDGQAPTSQHTALNNIIGGLLVWSLRNMNDKQ